MMIPITRKEKYINEIVGGGDTAPETPQTREELFFAEILGEVIAPSPVTRVEKYLSAIAGQYSGELPEPVTRIERFIARAAGMEIETPIPITREEMLWDTYIPIKTIEGIPPLTFKAKKAGTLKDYRIYGNTAGGESVGDLVAEGEHAGEYKVAVKVEGKNLIDAKNLSFYRNNDSQPAVKADVSNIRIKSDIFPITNKYPFIAVSGIPSMLILSTIRYYDSDLHQITNGLSVEIPQNTSYVSLLFRDDTGGITNETKILLQNSKLQVEYGDTPTTYEPYHAPITTPIYLPEPIKMVGDEAEYIDYANQKIHRIGADDVDVTLPELPTLAGTNVMTVGTEVQPSNVYIKYEGARQ